MTSTSRVSIAVLPFAAPEPDNEYLADGLAEDIIGAFARSPTSRCSRREPSRLRARPSRAEIVRDLKVRYFAEGSVPQTGGSAGSRCGSSMRSRAP